VGFESSRAARRRLAAIAATNKRVQEALSPQAFPGFWESDSEVDQALERADAARASQNVSELQSQLDVLAHDIVATPGAGGALLAAYAAQARALTMVVEAARRSSGSPLPAAVLHAAEAALSSPTSFVGLPMI
jgi:hypothetical protein